jgi:NitT/TauT family transport system ATP-binding protein
VAAVSALSVAIRRKTFDAPGRPPFAAIEGLEFEVPAGQFLCVVGPSGCGKSTLLGILCGLDAAFDGAVDAGGAAPGVMFQTPRLMPWKTALENVRLVASPEALAEGRPEALLARMGLGAAMGAYPARLSGGMQRRVALARAFVNRPRLLLLDEPFVSLDAPTAAGLRALLLALWRETGATVVFVTHDLREALFLSDRILFLTPSPARAALDFANPAPRPRAEESPALEALRAELLARRPELLAGAG